MLAPIRLRAAHRGVPTFLVTALLMGQSSMALAESPMQRQELSLIHISEPTRPY